MSKRKPARTIKARSASKIRSAAGSGQPKGRANSKQARVLALLCGPSGATIATVTRSKPLSLRTGLHDATRIQSPAALMSGPVISGLVCITFLVLLEFPAVPQEAARKGADTESGQLTFNNACRTCHTTKEGDNRLGPNLHNIIGRKAGSLPNYGYSSAMKGAD